MGSRTHRFLAVGVLLAGLGAVPVHSIADIDALEREFASPPDDARVMMRWWWFGSSVTRPQLERELQLMKQGGIGGIEVQPVYPLALDDERAGIKNLPFLSDEFLDALRFTAAKARELGLRFDLTLGSGWPYGGPTFPIDEAAGRLRIMPLAYEAAPGEHAVKIGTLRPAKRSSRPSRFLLADPIASLKSGTARSRSPRGWSRGHRSSSSMPATRA